jgi:hypothetical protein
VKGVVATFREAFRRAKEGQPNRPSRRKPAGERGESERSARNRDRTKTLFGIVAALVVLLIAFLGVFSSSQSDSRREPAARNRAAGEVLADTGNKNRVAPKAGTGRGNDEYELGNVQLEDPVDGQPQPR